ncbi:MAG: ArsB/NhaD family transporter [Alphaproteobacteria bacterium]|nr:ArsB/NhaD family transporter [Alphaproteobacteria bacterium]
MSLFSAQIAAVSVLIVCYVFLITEKLNRAVTVLLGASALIVLKVLTQKSAISGIDFNTILLLIGMMVIVGIAEKSGMFQALAILSAKVVKASPRGILLMFGVLTAVLSALLDNVTTVLLIVPITLDLTRALKLNPMPYLLLEIFTSNIGGTATLIGDPPNILIGSALHLSFMDFVLELTPIVIINLALILIVFDILVGQKLKADEASRADILKISAKEMITKTSLFYQSLFVLTLLLIGFVTSEYLRVENGTIALFGAALMLFLYTYGEAHMPRDQKVEDAFSLVDWTTIFFFCGLFVIVFSLETTGLLEMLGAKLAALTKNSVQHATFAVLWLSAVLSTLIDNIPFVATMIPTLKSMEVTLGGREAMMPVWWALSLGSCLGGNGSLIAASANVIVAGFASRTGQPIRFAKFLLYGLPVMLVSMLLSSLYLYLKYFL